MIDIIILSYVKLTHCGFYYVYLGSCKSVVPLRCIILNVGPVHYCIDYVLFWTNKDDDDRLHRNLRADCSP